MNHTYPALFVGGPLDGQRKFLKGSSIYHQVAVMDIEAHSHGDFMRRDPFDFPHRHLHHKVVEYQCVENIHGHRLFALRDAKKPDVMARLMAGYQGEGKH